MSIDDLKRWMEVNDKTVVDIASILSVHPNTVINYLKGKSVNRSTKAAFKRLIGQDSGQIQIRKIDVS